MRRGLHLVNKNRPAKLSRAELAVATIVRIQGELEDLKKQVKAWMNSPPTEAA